jgi:hypothetical protein
MQNRIRTLAAVMLSVAALDANAYDWIRYAESNCSPQRQGPAECARQVALVRSAMDRAREMNVPRLVPVRAGSDALQEAAAAVAAYVVLEALHPDDQPALEAHLAVQLADIPESASKAEALARGRRAGEQAR